MLEGNDWVVLYSDKQDQYHVERRAEYLVKGPTNGNWQIVASATSWMDAIKIVSHRRENAMDKPRRQWPSA